MPSPEELASLPAAELAVRLAGAYRLIAELTGQAERLSARVEAPAADFAILDRLQANGSA